MREDHDVLTSTGWKPIKQVTLQDKVACLDYEHKLIYEHPTEIHHYEDNKLRVMYHITSPQVDLAVATDYAQNIDDLIGKTSYYKKNATWDKSDYQFVLPATQSCSYDKHVDMDSWLLFFGAWVVTEGFISQRSTVFMFTHREELPLVLDKLGFTYSVTTDEYDQNNIRIFNSQLSEYLSTLSKMFLPDWVWKLSAVQSKILMNGMLTYTYTAHDSLADDFMRVCLHAGCAANIEPKMNGIWKHFDVYRNSFAVVNSNIHKEEVYGYKRQITIVNGDVKEELYEYDGSIYRIIVPADVLLYVRRNGKPVWTRI